MSESIEIRGGSPLRGVVRASGAKNAALPILISTLLSPEPSTVTRLPAIRDIQFLIPLLEQFGCRAVSEGNGLTLETPQLIASEASYSLIKALRASFWVLAPLLARGGAARVALPGGDVIGARPVDIHLEALSAMGAEITVRRGVVLASAPHGLKPAEIHFHFPSVGATHQILMAASLTPGTTVIRGAAREPEVAALAECLRGMGAEIEGAGEEEIVIRGRRELGGFQCELIGDRIEAATYLLAGIATRGEVTVEGIHPEAFGEFLPYLDSLGVNITYSDHHVSASAPNELRAGSIATGPFPRFATDIQALVMPVLCLANGESTIRETVYEGRFGHVSELNRMGARITVKGQSAVIQGGEPLRGATVEARDIRAGAALLIAGVAADGVTIIEECQHLRRGYETLEQKISSLGANVNTLSVHSDDLQFAGC